MIADDGHCTVCGSPGPDWQTWPVWLKTQGPEDHRRAVRRWQKKNPPLTHRRGQPTVCRNCLPQPSLFEAVGLLEQTAER